MLYYANETRDKNGFVYSLDMVRLRFDIPTDEEKVKTLYRYFQDVNRADIEIYPRTLKQNAWKTLITIDYQTTKLKMGIGFNGYTREDDKKCFVEFNPNKILNAPEPSRTHFKNDIDTLKMICNLELSRFDLAIDMPIPREDFTLFNRTGKKYELVRYSEKNKSECLGQRDSDGRIKLYNKALESVVTMDGEKIEDLTRLEITSSDASLLHVQKHIPDLYVKCNQLSICTSDVRTQTAILVELLQRVENPEYYIQRLEKHFRNKIKPLVFGGKQAVSFDAECLRTICSQALQYDNTITRIK